MEGFLDKKGDSFGLKGWKKRYFINSGSRLGYYESKEAYQAGNPLGYIPLHTATQVEENPMHSEFAFEIVTSEPKRSWILRAANEQEMEAWIDFCKQFIQQKLSQETTQYS